MREANDFTKRTIDVLSFFTNKPVVLTPWFASADDSLVFSLGEWNGDLVFLVAR